MGVLEELTAKKKRISVTGLGYVGLPLAMEFARRFSVIGFDINEERVTMMRNGKDPSNELNFSDFADVDIEFTSDPEDLRRAHFHIVGVPTDIDENKVPDLTPLRMASSAIGTILKKGDYVVYESTVYPGCTEEECLPVLEATSELTEGRDFFLGYSPERIVPGERVRTLTKIKKVVGANQTEVLESISSVYAHIIEAGIHKAPSIKVAEAAKIIENMQRDLNISLMNELAIIFAEIGIDTKDVLEAAGTKWNFHKYFPGLVGGHCISVDPYYLLHKARQIGIEPQVIAAGRRVNDYMPEFIASRIVKGLVASGKNLPESKTLIMGITFKENVGDIRNSKVINLVRELQDFKIQVDVHDPHVHAQELMDKFGIPLIDDVQAADYDAIVLAVAHKAYVDPPVIELPDLSDTTIFYDVKSAYNDFDTKPSFYLRL